MTDLAIKTKPEQMPSTSAIISVIERAAMNPDVDIEKMERLLQMQERIMAVQAKAEHAAAKTDALAVMPAIPKRGRGHNDMPFAMLNDIINITRPVLAEHGLSLGFDVRVEDARIVVTAKLTHRNGHEESTSLPLPFDTSGSKNAVQAIGSSQTYGQRYTAQALLGLSLGDDTDDDGRSGGAKTVSPEEFINLRDMLETLGDGDAAFLKHYGVSSLEMFPAAKFKDAYDLLEHKRKKREDAK